MLERRFNGRPFGIGVGCGDDDGNLGTFGEAEICNGSVENFVFFAGNFDEVFVVVVSKGADDSLSLDGADLFVEEFAVRGDCEFHEVAFNEL